MATFQVPQFIEQKPKIVGFLTLPQFLYLAGAAGISFAAFYVFNFFLWFVATAVAGAIAIAFAFVKINGQEFFKVALAAFGFFMKPRTFTWQRAVAQTALNVESIEKLQALREHMGLQERMKSIALAVTTGKFLSAFAHPPEEEGERYQTVTYLTGEKKVAKRIDYR
ncbi:MAG: hypothetical protein V1656_01275 [Candidatus Jorgensenbacteria bacterium]